MTVLPIPRKPDIPIMVGVVSLYISKKTSGVDILKYIKTQYNIEYQKVERKIRKEKINNLEKKK